MEIWKLSQIIGKRHNIFYRTTNQINWKYYFGIHSTDDLNDGYLGTGKLIKRAIKFHGKESFHLTIIQDYPTRKEASDHEKLAVTMFQVEDENCYNIKTGGDNECTYIMTDEHRRKLCGRTGNKNPNFGKKLSEETKKKISEKNTGRIVSIETRKKMSERQLGENHHTSGKTLEQMPHFGMKHSDESKDKMRIAHSGDKNHFYGKSHSEETKSLMRSKCKCKKPCEIEGIVYDSIKEASRSLDVSKKIITTRIKSNNPKWSEYKLIDLINSL